MMGSGRFSKISRTQRNNQPLEDIAELYDGRHLMLLILLLWHESVLVWLANPGRPSYTASHDGQPMPTLAAPALPKPQSNTGICSPLCWYCRKPARLSRDIR